MQFNEIFEKTKYAFENEEVYELLVGKNEYSYQDRQISASVPTMITFVFEDGVFPYYKGANDVARANILHKLTEAIQKLLASKDEVEVWWALFTLKSLKNAEARFFTSPFILADCFWKDVRVALLQNKEKLCTNKTYFGGDYADGLFGDVRRINRILVSDFGIDVLNGGRNG